MKRIMVCVAFFYLSGVSAFAIPISLFPDTDTFVERAKDIVIADCVAVNEERFDGLCLYDAKIITVLKGKRQPGALRLATIYPMKQGTRYMLTNTGGSMKETDFFAIGQLSVVPLPVNLNLEELKDKEIKEQLQFVLSRRLFEVEREIAPLMVEKALLEKGTRDRDYEWYETKGPIKIGPIEQGNTQTDETRIIWLDLGGKKLEWSSGAPGKTGYLYFEKVQRPRTPYWEFSPCEAKEVEDLAGKPLKTRFYGMYTPGRADCALGARGGLQAIDVVVGQVLLVRAAGAHDTVYIVQIVSQKLGEESMSFRYSTVEE